MLKIQGAQTPAPWLRLWRS